jgi:hypothetical protein
MINTDCYRISDGECEVVFGSVPVVLAYSAPGCTPLNGGVLPNLVIYNHDDQKIITDSNDYCVSYTLRADHASIDYFGEASNQIGAVTFRISFTLQDGALNLSWECLEEKGLDLVTITYPGLISICASDPSARLALTTRGGRLINPAICLPGSYEHRYNWVNDSFSSCAVLYNRDLTAVVSLSSLDDLLLSHVDDTAQGRTASIGLTFRHRYTRNDPSYHRRRSNMNELDPVNQRYYPVADHFSPHHTSSASIKLYKQHAADPEQGWVFGMKQIYNKLPPKRSLLYKDAFIYKVFIGNPGQPLQTSFAQTLDMIKAIYERIGHARQICYLVGFQHQGHDSMYPDVFIVNEQAGGRDGLLRLVREAESYNAWVSLHDNFDDAYRQSPMWDELDIAVANNGHLLQGGIWNGVQAYWISLPYYAAVKSRLRIKRTLREYPIKRTYHLDVLTASVFRLDFRRDAPKGKDDDLAARLDVVRQFRENGIDITSEACGQPFIGEISYFWHMPRVPRPIYKGDQRIPAIPFLIHGKADYAGSSVDGTGIMDALLYAAFYAKDITAATPLKQLTDAYYMIQVPLNQLRDEEAVDYTELAGYKQITYASGSIVRVNFESGEYEVIIEGRTWIKNGTAFFPTADGTSIVYVAHADACETPLFDLPEMYLGKTILCQPLDETCAAIPLDQENNQISFCLPPGVAYRIINKNI